MKTNQHLDALERARIEANATLRDMHLADYAVDELVSQSLPWTYETDSRERVIEMQLTGRVIAVERKWSWRQFKFMYYVTIRP